MEEISFDPSEPSGTTPGQDDAGALPVPPPTSPAGSAAGREEVSPPPASPSGEEPPRGGRGHTRECPALATDDVLRQCARPGCGRAKPEREPGKGGRPSKYCCKLCGNEASRAADSAPAAVATHTAVSAFTAEAVQIRAALHQRDAQLAAEREDLHRLDERLEQVWQAVAAQLAQAEARVQQAEADAEQARTAMRAAHAGRQTAEQERDAALNAQQEALHAQRVAEDHRDRIHIEARTHTERLGVQIGNLTTRLNDEQLVTTRQAEQLNRLAADLSRAEALAEERAEALAERDRQLHQANADVRRLNDNLEQTGAHLATTRQQLQQAGSAAEQARAETRAARDTLAEAQRRFEEERDRLRAQHDQARLDRATAETRLEMTERELQTLRRQLAAAQATTGLIVPPLADVDGQPGVRLPGCAFHAVTLHDGIVMLHHNDSAIALADAQQSPTQARTLSAALQAVTAAAPD
ncbi:Chromosome partition protein Smc [Nonomuraea coxensis DSM 45129]|uniref:Chromosome partition protein Smc n=1 Tax=Nonomuraea coxensis DSM 45129 TaxID=1122611 RepID=A0ABX8U320_9ACTN|nr:hypothetical protein [Nonomuraea coxensis]QYC42064.1 Chromosome partition protein Smc [Nonomuraea coxensis DSM 45129]